MNPTGAPCKFYQMGTCTRGVNCAFSHGRDFTLPRSAFSNTNTNPGSSSKPARSPALSSATLNEKSSSKQSSSTSPIPASAEGHGEEEIICAICFETPSVYGLLPSCTHVFCLECVRKWRTSKSEVLQDSGASKNCPVCRAESTFVCPSPTYPTEPSLKYDIINNYKQRTARIPCRYFTRTSRCPSGDECLYAHNDASGRRVLGVRRPAPRPSRERIAIRSVQDLVASFDQMLRSGTITFIDGVPYHYESDEDDDYEYEDDEEYDDEDPESDEWHTDGGGSIDGNEREEDEDPWGTVD
ncbi:hypothetical protein SmJEL517_g01727 [Synchytrium microbalum]|uniref:RING-type E3 ubiquitin transferase n=1 Tax=Synchytrium microbalum TaxID=1806994 RepID=A0A507C8K3_9FUNG|nr:uncharacterized protein SmJEL517_g01727 [Synchytrium microbalum]TPX35952.1 hypothetical protein SmJEL517_g01727 [Synchytrium microbalum]